MAQQHRIIKKYPNRRLYDTETSSYITLADVKKLVLEQVDFKVEDAKSNDDLTRSILLQIILEEESAGAPMFSSDMLSQIIRFYGNAMQGMMGSYLEKNIHTFIEIQKRLQDQSRQVYGENPMLNTDAWSEFLKMQGPAMQGLMGRYLEQSANAFLDMQQQLQQQTRNLFGSFPFPHLRPRRCVPPGRRRQARRRREGRRQEVRRRQVEQVVTQARPQPAPGAGRAPARRRQPPKVGFVSLGCPKALVDSERILTQLRAEGYLISPRYEDADLVVVNTCGFIDCGGRRNRSTRSAKRSTRTAR